MMTRALVVLVILTLAITAEVNAQSARRNLSACQLFAELDPYYRGITEGMLRFQIEQIYQRANVDRDPKIQDAGLELYKATVFSRDYGERFSTADRKLAQIRRDIVDPMTAMANACDPRAPSRAITPEEAEAQTKRATEKAPGATCETKTYDGGAVTICK